METYLTIEELADYLKLAPQSIRRWILNREIPYHKIKKVIRFRISEIEKWIDDGGYTLPDETQPDDEIALFDDAGLFDDANSLGVSTSRNSTMGTEDEV